MSSAGINLRSRALNSDVLRFTAEKDKMLDTDDVTKKLAEPESLTYCPTRDKPADLLTRDISSQKTTSCGIL